MGQLARLFQEVAQHPHDSVREFVAVLRSIAPIIKTHPLGFLQTGFVEDTTEYRLNIWGTSLGRTKSPNWQIHTHRFNFSSSIVVGRLIETQYAVTDDASGDFEVYCVEYSAGNSRLRDTGRRVRARVAAEGMYRSGQSYDVDARVYHRSELASDLAVTLMCIGEPVVTLPNVLGATHYGERFPEYVPQVIPLADVVDALSR
jgi:hypothetical protein